MGAARDRLFPPSGKHRFVHLRFAELLQFFGKIKAGRIGDPLGDGPVFEEWEAYTVGIQHLSAYT